MLRGFFQSVHLKLPEEETSRLKRTLGSEEYWLASKRVLSRAPAVVRRD
jgi:hypothetical protein